MAKKRKPTHRVLNQDISSDLGKKSVSVDASTYATPDHNVYSKCEYSEYDGANEDSEPHQMLRTRSILKSSEK